MNYSETLSINLNKEPGYILIAAILLFVLNIMQM